MASSIPLDVLLEILKYARKADLPTLCRTNKILCSCSQNFLYREVYAPDKRAIQTLARSTDLARRVRSFYTSCECPELATFLRNMSSLRILDLNAMDASILNGCTFKLDSFTCCFRYSESLQIFLNGQINLTDITFFEDCEPFPPFDETCLPNLTCVYAEPSWLNVLIPGRPVNDVAVFSTGSFYSPDLSFFTLSATPIERIWFRFGMLYSNPASLLVYIFPSLVHLEVYATDMDWPIPALLDVDEYIINLLAGLVHLRIFDFKIDEECPITDIHQFIAKVSDRVPHLKYFSMPFLDHHYKRVGGELVDCDETEHLRFEL